MPLLSASYSRDANHVPVTNNGFIATGAQTLSGNNTTVNTPCFRLTGSVQVLALYGVITTALGSNITAAFWRLNDQTAQVAISLATGTALSAAPAGSVIVRNSLVTVALALKSSAAGAVLDPVAAAGDNMFMPFAITQKTAAVQTDIEFSYTTTNTPTSGVIQHYVGWLPLSSDGKLVSVL